MENADSGSKSPSKKTLIISAAVLVLVVVGFFAFKGSSITGNTVAVPDSRATSGQSDQASNPSNQNVFNAQQSKDLINEILFLREKATEKDVIGTAKYYSAIDKTFASTPLSNDWNTVAKCAYDICSDDTYIDLIHTIAAQNLDDQTNKLVNSVIETYNLWDGKNQALFSASLTQTNALMSSQTQEIKTAWLDLVNCNGCAQSSAKTINVISVIEN